MLLLIVVAVPAAAQRPPSADSGIQWERDARRAVAQAQQSRRPLMFWILGSTANRDRRLVNAQRAAFADPRVLDLSRYFVPTRLSQSADADAIAELGLPPRINMEVVFVTPEGGPIDRLAASTVSDADALARNMKRILDVHRRGLYVREIEPVLTEKHSRPRELRTALERVRAFRITYADKTIVDLLARDGLDRGVAQLAVGVLAGLSTPAGIEKLAKLSGEGDDHASEALKSVTPVGAELLLEHLVNENGSVRMAIHDAIVTSCRIENPRPAGWWERAAEDPRKSEIDRVRALTKQAAERWRETHVL
jgi:hypothetical protein